MEEDAYLWRTTVGHYWNQPFEIAKKQTRPDEIRGWRSLNRTVARQCVVKWCAAEISTHVLMYRKTHGRKVCKTLT